MRKEYKHHALQDPGELPGQPPNLGLSNDPSIIQLVGGADVEAALRNHQMLRSAKKAGSVQM